MKIPPRALNRRQHRNKDVERYRFLKRHLKFKCGITSEIENKSWWGLHTLSIFTGSNDPFLSPKSIDEAIDTAMKEKQDE